MTAVSSRDFDRPVSNAPNGGADWAAFMGSLLDTDAGQALVSGGGQAPRAAVGLATDAAVEAVERLTRRRYVDRMLNVDPRNVAYLTRPELQVMRFRLAQLLRRARASQRLLDSEAARRGLGEPDGAGAGADRVLRPGRLHVPAE